MDLSKLSEEDQEKVLSVMRRFDEDTHALLSSLEASQQSIAAEQIKIGKRQDAFQNYGLGIASILSILFLVFGGLMVDAIKRINTTINQQLVIINRIERSESDIRDMKNDVRDIYNTIRVPAWQQQQRSQDGD